MQKSEIDKILEDEIHKLRTIGKYAIEIGVISGKEVRKVKVGINNAELMFIHENGSAVNNIPARPVLQMTLDYASDNLIEPFLDKCLNMSEQQIVVEMKKLCMKMQNYARDIIYKNDGRLAPNAPSVAKAKGGNHPLFDTGQLTRSITCRLVEIK